MTILVSTLNTPHCLHGDAKCGDKDQSGKLEHKLAITFFKVTAGSCNARVPIEVLRCLTEHLDEAEFLDRHHQVGSIPLRGKTCVTTGSTDTGHHSSTTSSSTQDFNMVHEKDEATHQEVSARPSKKQRLRRICARWWWLFFLLFAAIVLAVVLPM